MNNTLYVAARSRGMEKVVWATVGRLRKAADFYEFQYTEGAKKLPGVTPFPGMDSLDEIYRMEELFPIFKNRLLSKRRPEYKKWLSWGGFESGSVPDAMSILSTLGSRREADSIELYVAPQQLDSGSCYSQFFLHGVRHHAARELLEKLVPSMALSLRREDDNKHDKLAVAVDDDLQCCLGYVPRYLATDMRFLMSNCDDGMELKVKKVNLDAPSHFQVLCELTSCWPDNFAPCTGPDFEVIGKSQGSKVRSNLGVASN